MDAREAINPASRKRNSMVATTIAAREAKKAFQKNLMSG
jgi:hypothetical protein